MFSTTSVYVRARCSIECRAVSFLVGSVSVDSVCSQFHRIEREFLVRFSFQLVSIYKILPTAVFSVRYKFKFKFKKKLGYFQLISVSWVIFILKF